MKEYKKNIDARDEVFEKRKMDSINKSTPQITEEEDEFKYLNTTRKENATFLSYHYPGYGDLMKYKEKNNSR